MSPLRMVNSSASAIANAIVIVTKHWRLTTNARVLIRLCVRTSIQSFNVSNVVFDLSYLRPWPYLSTYVCMYVLGRHHKNMKLLINKWNDIKTINDARNYHTQCWCGQWRSQVDMKKQTNLSMKLSQWARVKKLLQFVGRARWVIKQTRLIEVRRWDEFLCFPRAPITGMHA